MTFLLQSLLAMLASLTHQELARQVVFLREENRVLRSRLSYKLWPETLQLLREPRSGTEVVLLTPRGPD